MTSFSRVALSLGLVAAFGGVLMFSIARGQDGAAPAPAPAPAGGTGSPVFKQTIGVSPVQTGKKSVLIPATFNVQGGTGNEIYDLQTENIYSLLRQRGAAIPNVLHPLSSAKPSFIVEKLMVISVTGAAPAGGANANANANAGAAAPAGETVDGPGAGRGRATPKATIQPPSEAEKTVVAVRRVVEAELTRGTGRLGGAHRQKLLLLRDSIRSLEAANRLGTIVNQVVNAATGSNQAGSSGDKDAKEFLYARARIRSREADRFVPTTY